MKCQHCGSTDIILIQGQNYCLNCGYAVTPPTGAIAAVTDTASAQATAKKLSPYPIKTAIGSKTPKSGRKPPGTKPEIVPSTPPSRQHSRAMDIKRSQSKPTPTATVHPVRFSLVAAVIAAAVSGSATALALWLNFDTDVGVYVIGATIIGLGIFISLAHTALLYGRSRSQDGRPAPREYWWMAARNGFMDVINVQLIALIAALLVIGVGMGAWQAALHINAQVGTVATSIVLGLVNLLLAWVLLGIYSAARLATPAVVVGGLSATEAVRIGWRLYRQAGGHLVAAGVEAMLGRAIAAAILAIIGYAAIAGLSSSGIAVEALGGGAAVALLVFCASLLTLEVDTKLWLTQYRHLATLCPPAERIRLLTGRVQSHTTS